MANSTMIMGTIPPPPGKHANFVDPPDHQRSIVALHAICLTLVTLALAMRLYTRKFITRKIHLDDYLCVLAWWLSVDYSIMNLQAQANGLGRHMWDIPVYQFPAAFRSFTIGVWLYFLVSMVIKLAFLFFYRHIFVSSRKTLLWVHGGIIGVILIYTTMFFLELFSCIPVKKTWDFTVNGHCFNPQYLTYSSGFINAFTDLYILLVPIPSVWALPLKTRRKVKVILFFCLGLCACGISIIRLGMLPTMFRATDMSWVITEVGVWGIIEVNTGLFCVCFLVFPAFLKHHFPAVMKLSQHHEESIITTGRVLTPTSRNFNSALRSDGNRSNEVTLNVSPSTDLEAGPPLQELSRLHTTDPEFPCVPTPTYDAPRIGSCRDGWPPPNYKPSPMGGMS